MVDGTVTSAYRGYVCTPQDFKKFVELFSTNKKVFYELHSHMLILFISIWQKSESTSNPMPDIKIVMDQTINHMTEIITEMKHIDEIGEKTSKLLKKYK